MTPVSRFASVSRVLEEFQVAPCLVCSGTNDQISPAVVAGVGVDAVDCNTQVPVSTISSFSLPGVFFLGGSDNTVPVVRKPMSLVHSPSHC